MLALFAVLWAAAALFHVWVNPWAEGVWSRPTVLGAASVLLSLAALVVLWRPRSLPGVGALAVLGVATCWLEAPVLGNHWLLAALVSLGLLLALVSSATSGPTVPRRRRPVPAGGPMDPPAFDGFAVRGQAEPRLSRPPGELRRVLRQRTAAIAASRISSTPRPHLPASCPSW